MYQKKPYHRIKKSTFSKLKVENKVTFAVYPYTVYYFYYFLPLFCRTWQDKPNHTKSLFECAKTLSFNNTHTQICLLSIIQSVVAQHFILCHHIHVARENLTATKKKRRVQQTYNNQITESVFVRPLLRELLECLCIKDSRQKKLTREIYSSLTPKGEKREKKINSTSQPAVPQLLAFQTSLSLTFDTLTQVSVWEKIKTLLNCQDHTDKDKYTQDVWVSLINK